MENFLDLLFTFIVWMNKHLFEPLNSSSVRIDSFIGIASIIIAVVIFVAETMNDKKSDTSLYSIKTDYKANDNNNINNNNQ